MQKIVKRKRVVLFSIVIAIILGIGILTSFIAYAHLSPQQTSSPSTTETADNEKAQEPAPQPTELYKGETTLLADSFSIKTPNGWAASISNSPNFLGIMFARPNQLDSLAYNPDISPKVDQSGIPSWNGLTEHFFIISPTPSRQFDPSDHLEVSSEPFTFDDGTIGQKYFVVKHSKEAQKWGGLQKGTEWHGRTYIYESGDKHIEAHVALYPSSAIDVDFYENVIRTIQIAP